MVLKNEVYTGDPLVGCVLLMLLTRTHVDALIFALESLRTHALAPTSIHTVPNTTCIRTVQLDDRKQNCVSVIRALISQLCCPGLGYYMDQPLAARLATPKAAAHAALASSGGGIIEAAAPASASRAVAVETAGGALQGGAGSSLPPTSRPNRLEQVRSSQALCGALTAMYTQWSQPYTSHLQCTS